LNRKALQLSRREAIDRSIASAGRVVDRHGDRSVAIAASATLARLRYRSVAVFSCGPTRHRDLRGNRSGISGDTADRWKASNRREIA
jgi:hypothetical protein